MVYKAYEPGEELRGLELPVTEVLGRKVTPANLIARQFDAQELLVLAAQDVVDLLVDEESSSLAELEDFIGIPIKFQVEALFTQEQYDVVIL